MIERHSDERLRSWYRGEVEDVAGQLPAALRSSVLGIPEEMPNLATPRGTSRRLLVLLAAAMLTALLVGAAIAVGSGLLRLPWLPDDRSQPLSGLSGDVLSSSPCDQKMPDGLLLSVELFETSVAPSQLMLNEAGLLLRGPHDPESSPWEQRRLSPAGVHRLLAAVLDSGLRDCQSVPIPGPGVRVKAEADGGVVSVSLGSSWMREPTQAELDAGARLGERMRDPDLGIPLSEWVDPAWVPYSHDRWQVLVKRWEGRTSWSDTGTETPWDEVVLPDGSTLRTFGSVAPRAPYGDFVELRCGVVGAAEAEAFRTLLHLRVEDPSIILQDRGGGVTVEITPVLPHEAGCGPDPAPPARDNLIANLRVCQYVPERTMRQVSGLYRPVVFEDFGGGWAACDYYSGGWLFASRHPIASDEALGVVENQFGFGNFTTDEIDGRTVYFSSCEPDSGCHPAIAISAEPHFVIIVGAGGEATLRLLAAAVIKEIERLY